jgi:RsiW-degrading membrane proteinase PrsW (M82 family)
MGIDPSALPWWGWLICALIAAIGCVIVGAFIEDDPSGCGCLIVTCLLGAMAVLLAGLGVIRFVKWAWTG